MLIIKVPGDVNPKIAIECELKIAIFSKAEDRFAWQKKENITIEKRIFFYKWKKDPVLHNMPSKPISA